MESESLHRALLALFESGKDAMFITDRDGRFMRVNRSFLELYAIANEKEVLGKKLNILKSNLHARAFYEQIRQALQNEGQWSGEIRNMRHDGEVIPVWSRLIALGDEGVIGIQSDLRTRDLSYRQLEQSSRLQSVSLLAGGVAHEFNNILASLHGHLHILDRKLGGSEGSEHERIVRIKGLLDRAGGLVQNLLSFARQKPPHNRPLLLAQLLPELEQLVRPTLPPTIQLRLEMPPESIYLSTDPLVLKQHLIELIANARDAIEEKMQAHMAPGGAIDLKVERTPQGILFRICDDGIGMEGAILNRAMEPFFSTKPIGKGTGLGLPSVLGYAEHVGGSLSLQSTPGHGACAELLLPIEAGQAREKQTTNQISRTLLLAEDETAQRNVIVELLTDQGHKVLACNNGLKALETWHSQREEIDAVICDIVMPGLDGVELAGIIRHQAPQLPICMMTGYSNRVVPPELGVRLLRKPVDLDLIRHFVDNLER